MTLVNHFGYLFYGCSRAKSIIVAVEVKHYSLIKSGNCFTKISADTTHKNKTKNTNTKKGEQCKIHLHFGKQKTKGCNLLKSAVILLTVTALA